MQRSAWLSIVGFVVLGTACSESATLPTAVPAPGPAASVSSCTSDPAQIQSFLTAAFGSSTATGSALARWGTIQQSVNVQRDLVAGRHEVVELTDFILSRNRQAPLPIPPSDVTSLINQLFCFVTLQANVTDPDNAWVVHVSDPTTTFVTSDKTNGIQLPANGVTANTLVTAVPTNPNALHTLLDNYASVYEWSLTPAQTLTPGTTATIGMCPDPAALANVPAGDLDALLSRLVLGHQKASNIFEVLARVPLPAAMALQCPTTAPASLHAGLAQRVLRTLAGLLLPERANAAARARRFTGGVGGSTSEFSPFGPVDPQLFATGGVGGSTSEFVRTNRASASIMSGDPTIDGTVGSTKTGIDLPSVTIRTYLGTPIPGIFVTYATGPAPNYSPAGGAWVCGANSATDVQGTAAVNCLNFGPTVQYRTAYTKLSATFTLPPELAGTDAQGNPVVTITPALQNWLIASHGPSDLVITQPAPGRTFAGGNPFSADSAVAARVEVRSDLGDVVTIATNAVTLSLNKNGFAGGAPSVTTNAVAGIANFSKQIATAATGYRFLASAVLSDMGVVNNSQPSNIFDVAAGIATRISVVGTANFGSVTTGNPVSPSPTVLVSDANNNPKAGSTVYWTPAGGMANGSTTQTTSGAGVDGKTSVTWFLGAGSNQLRASLQPQAGGAETFFTATLSSTDPSTQPCEPGAVKNAFGTCYFVTPGSPNGGGLFRMSGWLPTTGQ